MRWKLGILLRNNFSSNGMFLGKIGIYNVASAFLTEKIAYLFHLNDTHLNYATINAGPVWRYAESVRCEKFEAIAMPFFIYDILGSPHEPYSSLATERKIFLVFRKANW